MTYRNNKLIEILIKDFVQVIGISDEWLPDDNILLELKKMIGSLVDIKIKSFSERRNSIFYYANKKLDLNKREIKKFIDYVAKLKIYFNYHEKEIISDAFNNKDRFIIEKLLKEKIKSKKDFDNIMNNFECIEEDITIGEVKKLSDEKLNKFLNSLFSAYAIKSFDINEVRKYFTRGNYVSDMSYYDYLNFKYNDIFERKCSLVYLDITKDLFYSTNLSYEKFRNNILKMLDEYYNNLNNHCYLAINIESIKNQGLSYQWNLYSDIVIYCEKFREVNLKSGYFKPEIIEKKTSNYIKGLDIDKSKFEISNEGYTYKDCFVIPKRDDYDILILFQKNDKDERLIPCPECWSDNIQGNSYPTINVRSWECKNPLCSGKSKTNRGKRYSLESLIKQKAINEDENNIPIDSIRNWKLDLVKIKDKIEIINMLLRHYTLFGDKVDVYANIKIEGSYLGRVINNHKLKFDSKVNSIFEKFEESAFFKRFMYLKNISNDITLKNISNINNFEVYNMDAYEVVSALEDNSVDGAITSPPYYNAKDYSVWDNMYCYLYDMYNIINQIYRVLKNNSYFLYNIFDYFDNENTLVFSEMGKKRMILGAYTIYIFRKCGFELQENIIWFKGEVQGNRSFNQGNNSPYYQAPINAWEHIFVFKKGITSERFPSILHLKPVIKYIKGKNVLGHDAPYPKEIPKLLIDKLKPNSTIIDPFSGSMTTGRVAYINNIRSINVDFIKDYCRLGLKLLEDDNK